MVIPGSNSRRLGPLRSAVPANRRSPIFAILLEAILTIYFSLEVILIKFKIVPVFFLHEPMLFLPFFLYFLLASMAFASFSELHENFSYFNIISDTGHYEEST